MDLSLDLAKIFPLTFSLLGEDSAVRLRSDFEREWGVQHLHFFPMVVREKKYPLAVIEIADYEFQIYFLNTQHFNNRLSASANLILHASCQFVRISAASQALKKAAGLYVIWKAGNEVQERRLEMAEVAFLDRLREDLPVYRSDLNSGESQILKLLMSLGIVCENPPIPIAPA